jgi:GTPase SAR1 family protein
LRIDIAQKRIKACLDDKSTRLDLSNLGLTILPSEIGQLNHLQYLNIRANRLTDIKEVAKLTALTELVCIGNQLQNLLGVDALTGLTKLICSANQLTCLQAITGNVDLEYLDCGDNRLAKIEEVSELPALITLNCSENNLKSLKGIEALNKMTSLNCCNNDLISLEGIGELTSLISLCFVNNPIRHVPHSILNNTWETVRAYYHDIAQCGYLINNRHKMLLLGNGRVGKTTLAHALKDNTPQKGKPRKESTIGIALLDWPLTDDDGNNWKVRVWDFGGQELYHATHRLFQSQSAIYCVLWTENPSEQDTQFDHTLRYWLDLIHDNNSDSPVVVIKSKCDISRNMGPHNKALEDDLYCNLSPISVSAWDGTNMPILRTTIQTLINRQASLQIRIPTSWGEVRTKLDTLGTTISKQQFEALCIEYEILDAEALLTYLHQCGDVFYRDNHFNDTIFIDQNWALTAIYRLYEISEKMGNPRTWIERNCGLVSGSELQQIFPDYKPHEVQLFIGFMLQAQMLFSIRPSHFLFCDQIYVMPALLPAQRPKGVPDVTTASMQYRLSYPWLHRLAIERIIIACHHLSSKSHWWRDGIGIEIDKSLQCSIFSDSKSSTLTIAFWGLESEIAKSLARVIKTIENTKVASPISEEMWLNSKGWCEVSDIKRFAVVSEDIVDKRGNTHPGLAYYMMLGIECAAISEAPPIKHTNIFTEVYMNFEQKNVVGNLIEGNVTNSTVTCDIKVGQTPQELDNTLQNLEALISKLEKAEFQGKRKYLGQLDTIQEELQKPKPKLTYVEELLKNFSDIMNNLEKGQALYKRVSEFLIGCGVTF